MECLIGVLYVEMGLVHHDETVTRGFDNYQYWVGVVDVGVIFALLLYANEGLYAALVCCFWGVDCVYYDPTGRGHRWF